MANSVWSCVPKLLKDSGFLAPLLTRLTNFMLFQRGWDNQKIGIINELMQTNVLCNCHRVCFVFLFFLQDWRSVWAVHTAHKCWVLGNVDEPALQWWEPRRRQVCVCVCFNLDLCVSCGTFLSECLLFAFPVFCNTSTRDWNTESAGWGHSPPPQSHVSLHASLYSEDHMLLFNWIVPLVPFSAHDLRTPGSSQSSSPVHPPIPVSFSH